MSTMASQITGHTIVYSTVYPGADQRKHQSSASLAFVKAIHGWPMKSPHKWPVARKMFPFDDVIMQKQSTKCCKTFVQYVIIDPYKHYLSFSEICWYFVFQWLIHWCHKLEFEYTPSLCLTYAALKFDSRQACGCPSPELCFPSNNEDHWNLGTFASKLHTGSAVYFRFINPNNLFIKPYIR